MPIEKLYADSGQITTDAAMGGEKSNFCEENPATCIITGLVVVGGATWGIVNFNKKSTTRGTAPAAATPAAATPAPQGTLK